MIVTVDYSAHSHIPFKTLLNTIQQVEQAKNHNDQNSHDWTARHFWRIKNLKLGHMKNLSIASLCSVQHLVHYHIQVNHMWYDWNNEWNQIKEVVVIIAQYKWISALHNSATDYPCKKYIKIRLSSWSQLDSNIIHANVCLPTFKKSLLLSTTGSIKRAVVYY